MSLDFLILKCICMGFMMDGYYSSTLAVTTCSFIVPSNFTNNTVAVVSLRQCRKEAVCLMVYSDCSEIFKFKITVYSRPIYNVTNNRKYIFLKFRKYALFEKQMHSIMFHRISKTFTFMKKGHNFFLSKKFK